MHRCAGRALGQHQAGATTGRGPTRGPGHQGCSVEDVSGIAELIEGGHASSLPGNGNQARAPRHDRYVRSVTFRRWTCLCLIPDPGEHWERQGSASPRAASLRTASPRKNKTVDRPRVHRDLPAEPVRVGEVPAVPAPVTGLGVDHRVRPRRVAAHRAACACREAVSCDGSGWPVDVWVPGVVGGSHPVEEFGGGDGGAHSRRCVGDVHGVVADLALPDHSDEVVPA